MIYRKKNLLVIGLSPEKEKTFKLGSNSSRSFPVMRKLSFCFCNMSDNAYLPGFC